VFNLISRRRAISWRHFVRGPDYGAGRASTSVLLDLKFTSRRNRELFGSLEKECEMGVIMVLWILLCLFILPSVLAKSALDKNLLPLLDQLREVLSGCTPQLNLDERGNVLLLIIHCVGFIYAE